MKGSGVTVGSLPISDSGFSGLGLLRPCIGTFKGTPTLKEATGREFRAYRASIRLR